MPYVALIINCQMTLTSSCSQSWENGSPTTLHSPSDVNLKTTGSIGLRGYKHDITHCGGEPLARLDNHDAILKTCFYFFLSFILSEQYFPPPIKITFHKEMLVLPFKSLSAEKGSIL